MLIYESEGFLEVEAKSIQRLCRSTAALNLGDSERAYASVHAVLCEYLDGPESRCRVAFYSKPLKRAFVFTAKGSEKDSPWQSGQDRLVQLGFQFEDVNLNLSAAMLEVVLRDVPGILDPLTARKQRTEKSSTLAKLQDEYDEDPDSAQGKKAALKLNSEKRLNGQAEELRQSLEDLFAPKENVTADFEALASQVKDLTSRLETAESLAESERSQREMSETITAAAEKRIQELEQVLVDVDTKTSKTVKQKQKNVQLQGRIKELEKELIAAEAEVAKEHNRQEQFIADVTAAHEQISLLEKGLQEETTALEKIKTQLEDEKTENSRLSEKLKNSEEQISELQRGLKRAEQEAAQYDEAKKTSATVQTQLVEAQQALKDSIDLKNNLSEQLEKAETQVDKLQADLQKTEEKASRHNETEKAFAAIQSQLVKTQQALKDSTDLKVTLEEKLTALAKESEEAKERSQAAEKIASSKNQAEEQMAALVEQNERLAAELEKLREDFSQECSVRKRLEKGALQEDKRIQELEESLARALEGSAKISSDKQASTDDARQIDSLKAEVNELNQRLLADKQAREELEDEVDEAHKLIDSLEKMVRETETASKGGASQESSRQGDSQKVQDLEEKLKLLEGQLEQERIEQARLAKAVSAAEKKALEQEEALHQVQEQQIEKGTPEAVVTEAVAAKVKPAKPLPHELRPAPKKGALFSPDWDLEGLPCSSSKAIVKVWEAAFNVQISLEGYPSQYCMAFLVVLRLDKEKRAYLLYRLKLNKHTLVCVPTKTPQDEASLQKVIKEGLNFLKMSGFEMDEMKKDDIDSTLANYFVGA